MKVIILNQKLDIHISLIEDVEKHSNILLKFIHNYKNKLYIRYYENKINS